MAKNMYRKREERKNKKSNEESKSLPSTSINWDISIYGNTYANHCKIKLS